MTQTRRQHEGYMLQCCGGGFYSFFEHLDIIRLTGQSPIIAVRVILDDAGDHYTWHDYERDTLDYTAPTLDMVEICFPYGTKTEEERGRGKLKRCRVEALGKIEFDAKDDRCPQCGSIWFLHDCPGKRKE